MIMLLLNSSYQTYHEVSRIRTTRPGKRRGRKKETEKGRAGSDVWRRRKIKNNLAIAVYFVDIAQSHLL